MNKFIFALLLAFSLPVFAQQKASTKGATEGTFIPAGVIMPFGGATVPSGWLLCDGASVSRTTYAKLYAAIGNAWGTADGNSFNLPDLRGRFLRGRDGGAGRDPNAGARTASATGGNTGDAVGSVQTNATAKNGLTATTSGSDGTHTHGVTDPGHAHSLGGYSDSFGTTNYYASINGGAIYGNENSASSTTGISTNTTGSGHGHTVTIGAGDTETRPVNANVNYIIKI